METVAYIVGEKTMLIDADMLNYVKSHRLHFNRQGYATQCISRKTILLHRKIIGAESGDIVDHKNGNVLDNRRDNLRICTPQQNLRNSASRGGSSRFKGVCLCKVSGKWQAEIRGDKKKKIGRFLSEEEAARAYDEAAKIQFGEFARLNFPDKVEEEIIISAVYYHADYKAMTASKYRGVTFDKRSRKNPWAASISLYKKKKISLKSHATEEDAARAHDKKSWEIFRDPKKLNFPEEYLT